MEVAALSSPPDSGGLALHYQIDASQNSTIIHVISIMLHKIYHLCATYWLGIVRWVGEWVWLVVVVMGGGM